MKKRYKILIAVVLFYVTLNIGFWLDYWFRFRDVDREYNAIFASENLQRAYEILQLRYEGPHRIPVHPFYAGFWIGRDGHLVMGIATENLENLDEYALAQRDALRRLADEEGRNIRFQYVRFSMQSLREMQNYIADNHGMGHNADNLLLQKAFGIGLGMGPGGARRNNRVVIDVMGLHWIEVLQFRREVTDSPMVTFQPRWRSWQHAPVPYGRHVIAVLVNGSLIVVPLVVLRLLFLGVKKCGQRPAPADFHVDDFEN